MGGDEIKYTLKNDSLSVSVKRMNGKRTYEVLNNLLSSKQT
jgi:hypothetical protein